jgi:hypothetical protein
LLTLWALISSLSDVFNSNVNYTLGDEALALLRDIGQRIAAVTGEARSHQFLMQRLSVTVQRGNAACVLGTVASNLDLTIFFIYDKLNIYSVLLFLLLMAFN